MGYAIALSRPIQEIRWTLMPLPFLRKPEDFKGGSGQRWLDLPAVGLAAGNRSHSLNRKGAAGANAGAHGSTRSAAYAG